jgi:hypothetical protein
MTVDTNVDPSLATELKPSRMSRRTSKSPHVTNRLSTLVPTVFHEDWWLKICGLGQIQTVSIERNGSIIAQMPYMIVRRHGLRICTLPPLVHFSGPTFAPLDGPPQTQIQQQNDLIRDLLAALPRFDIFDIKMYHGITDTLAFQREGYRTTVQFTYEIDPASADDLLSRIRRGHRRMIREAQNQYTIDASASAREFVNAYANNIERSGKRFSYDEATLIQLIETCRMHGQGMVFAARDKSGDIKAGLFVMWDQTRMYNFMATRDGKGVESSASVLLLWYAIQEASKRQLIFDFDGVYNAGHVQYFSGFGGRVSPRYIVSRTTKFAQLAYAIQRFFYPKDYIF